MDTCATLLCQTEHIHCIQIVPVTVSGGSPGNFWIAPANVAGMSPNSWAEGTFEHLTMTWIACKCFSELTSLRSKQKGYALLGWPGCLRICLKYLSVASKAEGCDANDGACELLECVPLLTAQFQGQSDINVFHAQLLPCRRDWEGDVIVNYVHVPAKRSN